MILLKVYLGRRLADDVMRAVGEWFLSNKALFVLEYPKYNWWLYGSEELIKEWMSQNMHLFE